MSAALTTDPAGTRPWSGPAGPGGRDDIDLPLCVAAEPEERLAISLYEVARTWRARIDEQLRPLGLSSASWSVIFTLATADKPLSQREIADRLFVECPTVVRLLDRLEKLGWVRRDPAPEDRRRNQVRLTAKILEHDDTIHAMAMRVHREALAGIPEDKLAVALEVLQAIRGRFAP
ncbi:MarR family winged helix-turn-helix transcriptional regulator [Desulfolutivibrio sulfoxidireducens]|uniref:MarR family winged helix-turn-helix transcriptional regulator n=1 Tax=Desulfolutivibrio sulfoxidireducens TaxID=2773299 RepID=UPI00159DAFAC|nr:MarR family transcriptional regulator [Desulfolutivibrio sulfoxidireducens]QLA14876.1 MarR family transcriptional regulator [Desulfolutivibrio sulfoxidireducens]QLA18445.1 MarR family transcriptional regulator [Desulfolutivibrio sulfoxidireducens]